MTPSDDRPHQALIGPFARKVDKVAAVFLAAAFVFLLGFLLIVRPEQRLPIYATMASAAGLFVISVVRIRRAHARRPARAHSIGPRMRRWPGLPVSPEWVAGHR
ncbi:hypothetical protein [Nocardioides campestrisoli]|uniref:hypothetical protein n=1 Tax=Nocardioides campestrisoli TaxID=2736757 RepID=UPI0015E73CFB|nr:hypothetical protein [Nocardioides campestrisoli]